MGYESFETKSIINILEVYHSLARANFSAERGIRYGQDFYDERMQAIKLLNTESSDDGLPSFTLVDLSAQPVPRTTDKEAEGVVEKLEQTKLESDEKDNVNDTPDEDHDSEAKSTSEPPHSPKSKDPLRWFGILSPPSLRQVQSSASKLVETAVKLSGIDAEMKGVEIEIRRARKRKAKGEKVVDKDIAAGMMGTEAKQETGAKPLKINTGGGCGRVAI